MQDPQERGFRSPRSSADQTAQRYLGRGRVAAGVAVVAALVTNVVYGDLWFEVALVTSGASLVALGLLTMTRSLAARAGIRRWAGVLESTLFAFLLAIGVDENTGYVMVVALLMLVLAGMRGVTVFRRALLAAVVAEGVRQVVRTSLIGELRLDESLLGIGLAAVLGAVVARLVTVARAAERRATQAAQTTADALEQARTALDQRDQLHQIIAADIGQDQADLGRIVHGIANALRIRSVSILLLDEAGNASLAATSDPVIEQRDDLRPIAAGAFVEGPLARALADGPALATEEELADLSDWAGPLGAVSLHPLRRADGTAIGALGCVLPAGRVFSDDELTTIGRFADQTSLAIEAARAVEREAELAQRYRDLDRLKTDFVAVTSHELRTPLTTLTGAIEVLRERGHLLSDQDREHLWQAMQRQGERLARLVDDLRTVSLVDSGTLSITPEPTDIVEVVTDTIETVPYIPTDLRVDEPVTKALADPDRLAQVVTNLVVNGAQHGQGRVHLHIQERDLTVLLRVWDDGPGIPVEEREAIFGRFVRLGDTDAHQRGTGLGLAIARELVEAMHGSIHVTDHPSGSCFEVRLPIAA
jgi:signal transduction histidine kinase